MDDEVRLNDFENNRYGAIDTSGQHTCATEQQQPPYQFMQMNDEAEFTIIFAPDVDDVTGKLLADCKKFVLRPYNVFLFSIGWRTGHIPQSIYHNNVVLHNLCRLFCSCVAVWPMLLLLLLVFSCVTQILLCFPRDNFPLTAYDNITDTYYINCSGHLVSSFIIPDALLIGSFIYGLIIFRLLQLEDLSIITQKVSCNIESGKFKLLARSMLFFLILGIAWILYSVIVSILRIFSHHLFDNVELEFIANFSNSTPTKVVLIVISQIGFIIFDISYASIVINYAMQCQLMVYSLDKIVASLFNKTWTTIDDAIREINITRLSIRDLNGHLSYVTSVIMFIFLYSSVSSLYNLHTLSGDDENIVLIGVTGFLAVIQWSLWLFIPIIQAARVTYFGNKLKETALEIRSRPFRYRDIPQIDLDSLVSYCCNVEMKATLISIPVTPQLFFGGFFLLGFIIFLVLKLDNFPWIEWL